MAKQTQTKLSAIARKRRVRAKSTGTVDRPRLSVHISNMHITAQVIDDSSGKTLSYSSTIGETKLKGTMLEKATWVGTDLAKKAKAAKVSKVVFDRGSKLYHGRIKALATAAREGGLEF